MSLFHWPIQTWRAFSFCFPLIFVFIYYYCYPLHVQIEANGPVAARLVFKAWECLRSGVRPMPPTFIFLNSFQCNTKRATYHTPSLNHLPDGPRPDLVIQMERPPCYLVKVYTLDLKKSARPTQLGHGICFSDLQIRPTPLTLFIHFNCLFYFYLIIN